MTLRNKRILLDKMGLVLGHSGGEGARLFGRDCSIDVIVEQVIKNKDGKSADVHILVDGIGVDRVILGPNILYRVPGRDVELNVAGDARADWDIRIHYRADGYNIERGNYSSGRFKSAVRRGKRRG